MLYYMDVPKIPGLFGGGDGDCVPRSEATISFYIGQERGDQCTANYLALE